jgi:hypothetical protein
MYHRPSTAGESIRFEFALRKREALRSGASAQLVCGGRSADLCDLGNCAPGARNGGMHGPVVSRNISGLSSKK